MGVKTPQVHRTQTWLNSKGGLLLRHPCLVTERTAIPWHRGWWNSLVGSSLKHSGDPLWYGYHLCHIHKVFSALPPLTSSSCLFRPLLLSEPHQPHPKFSPFLIFLSTLTFKNMAHRLSKPQRCLLVYPGHHLDWAKNNGAGRTLGLIQANLLTTPISQMRKPRYRVVETPKAPP